MAVRGSVGAPSLVDPALARACAVLSSTLPLASLPNTMAQQPQKKMKVTFEFDDPCGEALQRFVKVDTTGTGTVFVRRETALWRKVPVPGVAVDLEAPPPADEEPGQTTGLPREIWQRWNYATRSWENSD